MAVVVEDKVDGGSIVNVVEVWLIFSWFGMSMDDNMDVISLL